MLLVRFRLEFFSLEKNQVTRDRISFVKTGAGFRVGISETYDLRHLQVSLMLKLNCQPKCKQSLEANLTNLFLIHQSFIL